MPGLKKGEAPAEMQTPLAFLRRSISMTYKHYTVLALSDAVVLLMAMVWNYFLM